MKKTTSVKKPARKVVRRRKPTFDDVCEALLRLEQSQEMFQLAFQREVEEWTRRFEAERVQREKEEAKRREEEAKRREEEAKRREEEAKRREEEEAKRREEEAKRREEEEAKRLAKEAEAFDRREAAKERAFERRWNKLEGMFTSQWGKLVEQLVNGDLVRVLNQRGIAIHRTSIRNGGCFNGQNYEFDIIACNGDTIVVVEVKTTLRPDDVKHFTEVMKHFRDYMPEYSGKKVQAGFGYLSSDAQAAEMARKDGYWTIHAAGGSAKIDNNAAFKPRLW